MHYFDKYDVGKIDRIIRVIFGVAIAIYTYTEPNILTGIMSLLLLYSGISGQCKAYRFLGMNTGCNVSETVERTTKRNPIEGLLISISIYAFMFIIYLIYRYFELP